MAHKALGRDLGDLLSQARPARLLSSQPPAPSPAAPDATPVESAPIPAAHDFLRTEAAPLPNPDSFPPAAPAPPLVHASGPAPTPAHTPVRPAPRTGQPPPSGSPAAFYVLLGLDILLLGAAALFAFTDLVDASLSRYLAVTAVLAGAVCSTLAWLVRPSPPPPPGPSRVRVHLRRI